MKTLPFQAATEKETLELIQREDCTKGLFVDDFDNNDNSSNDDDNTSNTLVQRQAAASPLAIDFCNFLRSPSCWEETKNNHSK
jgi:hypothetical protein